MAGSPIEETQRLLRKGVVNDWRNYFTSEQSTQLDEEIALRTAGSGLDFMYSD